MPDMNIQKPVKDRKCTHEKNQKIQTKDRNAQENLKRDWENLSSKGSKKRTIDLNLRWLKFKK